MTFLSGDCSHYLDACGGVFASLHEVDEDGGDATVYGTVLGGGGSVNELLTLSSGMVLCLLLPVVVVPSASCVMPQEGWAAFCKQVSCSACTG